MTNSDLPATDRPAREPVAADIAGLHVLRWPGAGPTIVGLPGLGSTGWSWQPLAAALPGTDVVAPDLRGRGGSLHAEGPTGLRAHARDVAAVLRELDLHDVVLVGHSMGAYLAPVVAIEAPERVARMVLLDGGVPPAFPFFMRPAVVRAMFRRQMSKVVRPWPDVESFVAATAERALDNHPELVPVLADLVAHDLAGPPGALVPALDVDRLVADAVDTFFGPDVPAALAALTAPAHLLAATGQKRDGGRPFLSDKAIRRWTDRQPLLTWERVECNHVTIPFTPEAVAAVAS